MVKFLDATGVSHYLTEIIKKSNDKIYLVSPFLKINTKMKELLKDKDNFKLDIKIVYGKREMDSSESDWIKNMDSMQVFFLKNLHAKCYLNEDMAIVTSMNLYEFSQQNNNEMGIFLTRKDDLDLYNEVMGEVRRLIRQSEDVSFSDNSNDNKYKESKNKYVKSDYRKINNSLDFNKKYKSSKKSKDGFCIRCGTSVKYNPDVPYCKKCYNTWKDFSDDTYEEKACHSCGMSNPSTMVIPECRRCYRKNKK